MRVLVGASLGVRIRRRELACLANAYGSGLVRWVLAKAFVTYYLPISDSSPCPWPPWLWVVFPLVRPLWTPPSSGPGLNDSISRAARADTYDYFGGCIHGRGYSDDTAVAVTTTSEVSTTAVMTTAANVETTQTPSSGHPGGPAPLGPAAALVVSGRLPPPPPATNKRRPCSRVAK